jgi:Spy/CpxP family protein refolding chaperone
MKRLATIVAFFAATAFAVPALAAPTGWEGTPPPSAGQKAKRTGKGLKNKGQMQAFLTKTGISQATAKQVFAIRQQSAQKRKAARAKLAKHRRELVSLLQADSNDQSAYRVAMAGMEQARNQLKQIRDADKAAIQKLLTPKQQAQVAAAMHKRRNNAKGKAGIAPKAR